jgi:dihydrofolate reductase
MAFFRSMITGKVCLMGRKTWESITWKGKKFMLANAIVFILTSGSERSHQTTDHSGANTCTFGDWSTFVSFYHTTCEQTLFIHHHPIMVCGGEEVYRWCMIHMYIQHVYVSRVMKNFQCDRFFRIPLSDFLSVEVSPIQYENDVFWKRIHYVRKNILHVT